jgi:hypothetical protein
VPEPVTPSPAAPDPVPAPPPEPVTPPVPEPAPEPAPAPAPEPVLEPEPAPAPWPEPEPVPEPEPGPVPLPEPPPAPTAQETATVEAGLAAAAATTTELAPHPAVPVETLEFAPPEPPRRRGWLLGLGIATLPLAAAVALVYAAGSDGRAAERLADRRAEALAQARQLALNLVSIDYRTLDRDLKRISDSTTGKAREEFDDKILKNDSYKDLVRDNKAVITSTIQRIGLEPCGAEDEACLRGDTAVVLVFLDQESKNKLRTTPRVDRNRVALTLVRRGDRWLVSEVKVV